MKTWHWVLLGILAALSLIVELAVLYGHGHHWWSVIPGFYILWGFLGSLVLAYTSKWFGHTFLSRDKDYYEP